MSLGEGEHSPSLANGCQGLNSTTTSSIPVAPASTVSAGWTTWAAASKNATSSWGVAAYTSAPVAPASFTGAASMNKIELGVIALVGLAAAL